MSSTTTSYVLGALVVVALLVRMSTELDDLPKAPSQSLVMITDQAISICEPKAIATKDADDFQVIASMFGNDSDQLTFECVDEPVATCCLRADANEFGVRLGPTADKTVAEAKANGQAVYVYAKGGPDPIYVVYMPRNDRR